MLMSLETVDKISVDYLNKLRNAECEFRITYLYENNPLTLILVEKYLVRHLQILYFSFVVGMTPSTLLCSLPIKCGIR